MNLPCFVVARPKVVSLYNVLLRLLIVGKRKNDPGIATMGGTHAAYIETETDTANNKIARNPRPAEDDNELRFRYV